MRVIGIAGVGVLTALATFVSVACHDVNSLAPCGDGTVSINGACVSTPSCVGVPSTCGPSAESCCASTRVAGGSFQRGFDYAGGLQDGQPVPNYATQPTTVQVSPYYLDRYEITIGRFRKFLAAYDGGWTNNSLHQGNGRDPNRETSAQPDGGASTTGWWSKEFEPFLLATGQAVRDDIAKRCSAPNGATDIGGWTPAPSGNENKPMPCITWFEAFMFCIFDGARLPTDAEWAFAAAGGAQQRAFPWSNPPANIAVNDGFASFGSKNASEDVGSHPAGVGAFLQYDLAGNVWEWTLDSPVEHSGELSYGGDSNNPIDFGGYNGLATGRVVRGGSFQSPPTYARVAGRLTRSPNDRYRDIGARCARPALD